MALALTQRAAAARVIHRGRAVRSGNGRTGPARPEGEDVRRALARTGSGPWPPRTLGRLCRRHRGVPPSRCGAGSLCYGQVSSPSDHGGSPNGPGPGTLAGRVVVADPRRNRRNGALTEFLPLLVHPLAQHPGRGPQAAARIPRPGVRGHPRGGVAHPTGQERGHLVQVAGDVAITVAADAYDSSPIDPDDISDVGVDRRGPDRGRCSTETVTGWQAPHRTSTSTSSPGHRRGG